MAAASWQDSNNSFKYYSITAARIAFPLLAGNRHLYFELSKLRAFNYYPINFKTLQIRV